ncbi:FAD-binding oxidoreductase [Pseudomonas sp. NFACC08-1]|uniref:NAD(P)/FAD-dependent oxidoreductase n=1 Tax=Pseudomonas sp. NFACC08-1 TaxID=1566238 RepID=UPI00089AB3C8|nr:FAD-dependent oxidoreductase [Pseudomonas sp. NFACC08-1]SDY56091.1 Glycine/D-amino acid oxidase [Pseudomonas sp. NFACC08-1]
MKSIVEQSLSSTKFMPFWLDSPDAPSASPAFSGSQEVDLVVIGGGFTGLWTAILAKEANPTWSIIVLEAGRVAHGASGRPGGIISTSVMHGLANEDRVFPDDIDILERLGMENLDGFKKALADYGIDADVEWNGEMTIAVKPEHVADLKEEYELHLKHGHEVQFLDAEQTRKQLKSPMFVAGMWSQKRSGIINPAKLAWGLKAAAIKLGVQVHENSKMTELSELADGMLVRTEGGKISAPKVFLATNAWHAGQRDIKRRIIAVRDHVLATEPLSQEQLARIGWGNRQGVYDTRTQLNYMRLTADNRVIFGGSVSYHFNGDTAPKCDARADTYYSLAEAFYTTFPSLKDVRFSHAWGGPIDYSMRFSVFFRKYFSGKVVYAGGYTGFGVAGSRFGASMGLGILTNNPDPIYKLAIAIEPSGYIPPEPFRWIGAKITFAALSKVDEKGGWRRLWLNFVKVLGFPF